MTVIEDYQTQTGTLATQTVTRVAAIYAALRAGDIAQDHAEALIAAAVNLSTAAAVTLADVFITTQIEEAAGVPTPTIGLPPTDDADRLGKAHHPGAHRERPGWSTRPVGAPGPAGPR